MIFHLQAAGVPTSWLIVSAYKNSYGIAVHAARAWMEREAGDKAFSCHSKQNTPPHPHIVIKFGKDDDDRWYVKRFDLMMSRDFLLRQQREDRLHIQEQTSPFPLDPALGKALSAAVRQMLIDFGYLIPVDLWERRYPGQKLIQDHVNAFNRAYDAHRESGSTDDMPFEMRWTPFMQAPAGFTWPYGASEQDGVWQVTDGDVVLDLKPQSRKDAEAMARLLNSGYRLEDVPVLMKEGPVEDSPS